MASLENGRKARILHVEDDEPHRRIVNEILTRMGHEVARSVGTVAEALPLIPDVLVELAVDVAILDEKLPDGSGQTVAAAIRKAELPITIYANSGQETKWGDFNIAKPKGVHIITEHIDGLMKSQPPHGKKGLSQK
jgi:DNA-binding NtrC family response regulator